MRKIGFSIVVVNYNGNRYLDMCLSSIVSQVSGLADELIIIDGGSSDGSQETIQKYRKYITYFVSEPDNGQSDALNKGFSVASADYVFWVNSDDLLYNGALEKLRLILGRSSYPWVGLATVFIDEESVVKDVSFPSPDTSLFLQYGDFNAYGPSMIIRRDLLSVVKNDGYYFDPTCQYCMDTDLWFRLLKLGIHPVRLDILFWIFRVHAMSKTSHAFKDKPNKKFSDERLYIRLKSNRKELFVVRILQKCWKVFNLSLIKSKLTKFRMLNWKIL